MMALDSLPPLVALAAAVLVVVGATLTLIGAYGLARLDGFYDRLHAPTLGTSCGVAGVILASMLVASYVQGRPVVHEVIIGFGALVTVPVTLMLLSRAALHRDRLEGAPLPTVLRVGPDGQIERDTPHAEVADASSDETVPDPQAQRP